MAQSRILKEMHESARGLHEAGIISDTEMREFDELCLPKKRITSKQKQNKLHTPLKPINLLP